MPTFPTGTVTFLFTDIEASTMLWELYPQAMKSALATHDAILRQAIEANDGQVIKTTGDGFHAVFSTAFEAAAAALAAQQALHAEAWNEIQPQTPRVRMSLHTGEAELRGGDYFGGAPNRAARLMSIGHGGQILISNATAELLWENLPANTTLRDLGEQRLKDLARPEHVFQLAHPSLPSDFPPLKAVDAIPNNLPVQLSSFIGRDKEIAEIKELLRSTRLITLTGSGGTGKSRLSQEFGSLELVSYPQGVWLIELATLTDSSQIIPAMAQVFGLQALPMQQLPDLVIDFLRSRQALLILDNCEHLIEACARLVDDLLHQCTRLKIIASSREALGIAGEVAYRTPSLDRSESIQLFVERAGAANPKFNWTENNASAIIQICTRLDGIPLAIELAASRSRLLSPEQIASRLNDRFRLLVGGSRTALPRQQTLRALIDWSYDLLSGAEKRLLQFASVFIGGWTLDALETVAGDPNTLELLEQLVNKSLVTTEEHGTEMRYSILETIRQYAREKLFDARESSIARDRHFFYFTALAEKMMVAFRSADFLHIRDRADDEVDNFLAALDWGMENQVEAVVGLAANFCIISSWMGIQTKGLTAVRTAIENILSLPPVEGENQIHRQKLIGWALFAQGIVALGQGQMPLTLQSLSEAIALSRQTGDRIVLGYSLEMYFTATRLMNAPGGDEAALEGFEIFSDDVNDKLGWSMAYLNMARFAAGRGDEQAKLKYFGKLKERIHETPLSFQVGMVFLAMGLDESANGNYETARKIFEDGLEIFTRVRSMNFKLVMKSELGHIARHTGNFAQARAIYQETIQGWQEVGNRAATAHQLECFGYLAIAGGETRKAIRLFAAAEALREASQAPMTDLEQAEYGQAVTRLHSVFDEAEFNTLWASGRTLTSEQAILFALEETSPDLGGELRTK